MRPDTRGAITAGTPPILSRFGLRESQWTHQVLGIENRYHRAIGHVDALIEKAHAMGQCWLKGLGMAKRLMR